MKKKILIILMILIAIIVGVIAVFIVKDNTTELKEIKSEAQLLNIYENDDNTYTSDIAMKIIGMPFSAMIESAKNGVISRGSGEIYYDDAGPTDLSISRSINGSETAVKSSTNKGTSSKDYSTTNIQVENVDEADITKTDGDYIYSISENQVIITNVINPEKPEISSKIPGRESSYPEDLILNNNQLVVISQNGTGSRYYSNKNTLVSVYDITDRKNPILKKGYELYEPYYTSRCINNKIYVISSGKLRKENDKITRKYKENNIEKEIQLNSIKYLKDIKTDVQTIFSTFDLENLNKEVDIKSYLIDISNAYVSENSFYLLDQDYEGGYRNPSISSLFGPKGVIGFFEQLYGKYDYEQYGYKTKIYKFNIKNDGNIEYTAKTKIEGRTINQYSLDEKNGHLRVALSDNNGSRVAIFDENLNKIGQTQNLAKGETMYSSRFMGDRAYLVTYRTVDPLWVIDLSNESNPYVLGELSIPGYSTYLHPYDETHLIGIGMETEEFSNRDSFGRVLSTSSRIIGMKMALFDVSNVANPKQISSTVIGDSRTTSSILTNPKALLFSKEKQLIAIPVNRYNNDFEISSTNDSYSSIISAYRNKSTNYIAEGYLVYNINLEEGFNLKGLITHENTNLENNYYSYYYTSKMLRGMYIENNLYTVSETMLKVNNLDNLGLISEIKIKGE